MKNKLALFFLASLFLLSFASATSCYQESPITENQTSIDDSCGLNYGGSTSIGGGTGNSAGLFYPTYIKPLSSTGAIWKVKAGDTIIGGIEHEFDIPSDCWDYSEDELSLLVNVGNAYGGSDFTMSFSCYNGTWETLDWNVTVVGTTSANFGTNPLTVYDDGNWGNGAFRWGGSYYASSTGNPYPRFYEEAVNWSVDYGDYYLFENNTCLEALNVSPSDVTPNHYATLGSCEANILYDWWRYDNNSCAFVELVSGANTSVDYSSLGECEENIIFEAWRYENNSCASILVNGLNITENDYDTFEECELNLFIEYWRFEDNACSNVSLLIENVTANDYETLEACEDNIDMLLINQQENAVNLYGIMSSAGAGIGIFMQIMSVVLPILLIGLAFALIIIAVGYALSKIFTAWGWTDEK